MVSEVSVVSEVSEASVSDVISELSINKLFISSEDASYLVKELLILLSNVAADITPA